MADFRRYRVWEKAHQLTLGAYRVTCEFPPEERTAETSQLRRATTSISANIAEGMGRGSDKDRARFLHFALGSAYESEYHLLLARDLRYITDEQYQYLLEMLIEVRMMLSGLLRKLKADRC